MPRPRVKRQPCDCVTCVRSNRVAELPHAVSLARQEPPPKSLILIVDGGLVADRAQPGITSLDLASIPHLDEVSREGYCGMLACALHDGRQEALESQLLRPAPGIPASLPERFKGMQAAFFKPLQATSMQNEDDPLERIYGCKVVCMPDKNSKEKGRYPDIDAFANSIASSLRIMPLEEYVTAGMPSRAAECIADDEADVAFVLLRPSVFDEQQPTPDLDPMSASCELLEWLDSLVRALDVIPGFKDVCLLSLVIGMAQPPPQQLPMSSWTGEHRKEEPDEVCRAAIDGDARTASGSGWVSREWNVRRPMQSYQFSGPYEAKVDATWRAVVVHRLAGVTRRDRVQSLNFADIARSGGGGCILAERMLPEVAYKLGKAPKYGA